MGETEELKRRVLGPEIPGFEIESLIQNTGSYLYKAVDLGQRIPCVVKAIDLYQTMHSVGIEQGFYHEKSIYDTKVLQGISLSCIETGESNGWAYIVLPYCAGGSLKQKIQYTHLTTLQVWALFKQVVLMLSTLHDKGWLHRDLKPSNIVFDEHDNMFLIDFGVAHEIDTPPDHFEIGKVYGSPAYMSPELACSDVASCSADLYSLGVMLYEMLEGKLPFIEKNYHAMIYAHMEKTVPRLSKKNSEYQYWVDKLMSKIPEERGINAQQLYSVLE